MNRFNPKNIIFTKDINIIKQKKMNCKTCKKSYSKNYYNKHIQTKKHKMKVIENEPLIDIGTDCIKIIYDYKNQLEICDKKKKTIVELKKKLKKRKVYYKYIIRISRNRENVFLFRCDSNKNGLHTIYETIGRYKIYHGIDRIN